MEDAKKRTPDVVYLETPPPSEWLLDALSWQVELERCLGIPADIIRKYRPAPTAEQLLMERGVWPKESSDGQ